MEQSAPVQEPQFPVNEIPASSSKTLFIISGALTFLLVLFGSLIYLNILPIEPLLPFMGTEKPGPTPITQVNFNDNPALPVPLNASIVQGVSVYYRLVGVIAKVNPRDGGDIGIEIQAPDGLTYPREFLLSATQTIVTEKGKGFKAFDRGSISVGDRVELIYSVDLRTQQSVVTQAQLEKE